MFPAMLIFRANGLQVTREGKAYRFTIPLMHSSTALMSGEVSELIAALAAAQLQLAEESIKGITVSDVVQLAQIAHKSVKRRRRKSK